MDNLTPQLNDTQLRANIDALVKQNAPRNIIQSYIDNYQKSPDGNYVLKNTPALSNNQSSTGNIFANTPEEAKARADTAFIGGKNNPITGDNSVKTQVQDIGNQMANTYQKAGADTIANAKTAFGASQTPDIGSFGANFMADLSKRLAATGHIAGDIAGTALAPLVHVVAAFIPPDIKNDASKSVNWVADKLTNNPQILNVANTINKSFDQNPDLQKALTSDLPNALGLLGGSKASGANPEINLADMKSTVGGDLNAVKTGIVDTAGKVKTGISDATSGVIDATKAKITDLTKGKSEAQILATPQEQVYKLSPSERKVWFDNETAKINTQADTTSSKIKANLNTQADATTKTATDLQKQLAVASRDKVIELRPKIVAAMGEQSKIYRNLIDEEMAGKENTPVQVDELKTHIDSQYGDNPALATAIKEKLGLTESTPTLKKGELPSIQSEGQTKTLGELYNQTKALRQNISIGATKGTKVFTPADKLVDDAIHTLTDFMKTKGVDFKEANRFWSKYAPIRNQLVSESKPFLQTGTQTKTFANTLRRVSQGTDVNNENFINEVENLVKQPITKEAKSIVNKLDANDKAVIANKIEAESKLVDTQMAKDKALSKLSSTQFEIERQARIRGVVKKVIIGSLGLLGAKELGITKFFGL